MQVILRTASDGRTTVNEISVAAMLGRCDSPGIQSSRRLEREAQRNVELMWLHGRLAPDFKTIADFRKDNPKAIRAVCRQFVGLCRELGLFGESVVAIDGSKFKAVNNRDRNFTSAKLKRRVQEIQSSIDRYLAKMDSADRQEPKVANMHMDKSRQICDKHALASASRASYVRSPVAQG